MEKKPKVIVFDLDYTLWPFWVDTHVDPPFKKGAQNKVVDALGRNVNYYSDVSDVLKQLSEEGYELGIASRTSEIKGAKQLIGLYDWKKYFKYIEIFPGSKVVHFSNIQKSSHTDYKDMIFFDDEDRNIIEVGKLGVHAVLVRGGISHRIVEDALQSFSNK
ncbi:PREDICTED: magnesium-dependent phosphatase 1-like [Cyphomyrmex costatus]|uniref:Magnesium-dependent phosphatase 1 n=1 Tax=Cyphomyrmex costatus TaxID=456900 RepID=A0A151IE16_9HYME|nr:PREDICTED: magnesium-dependent phosphatase 1-like [Cyphomyrmex costatus]KYM98915.1 Magnesium-dependent phosphatase 1 [Cyphomyrmex costatus]